MSDPIADAKRDRPDWAEVVTHSDAVRARAQLQGRVHHANRSLMPVETENGYAVQTRTGTVLATFTTDTAGEFLWGRLTTTKTEFTTEADFLAAVTDLG